MRLLAFLGGMLFAVGLLLFLYGAFNQLAVNVVTQFGWTEQRSIYQAAIQEFQMYQLGGGAVAAIGAGLATLRQENMNG
jgi:hypothetical protein